MSRRSLHSWLLQDPLDDEFHQAWNETSRINAEVYQELFHCTPAKGVKTWDDYAKWVPPGNKVGHIHNQENLELSYIKQRLSQIRGHVVEMPTGTLVRPFTCQEVIAEALNCLFRLPRKRWSG